VLAGRPWELAAPGPMLEARLPSGCAIALPAQLRAQEDRAAAGDPLVWGDLLRDPAIVMATESPVDETALDEVREHLDALLSKRPEGTRIVEPPTRVQRSGLTVIEARYVHRTGSLWESAVVLIPGDTSGSSAEILRIDVLLHAGASGAWRGLATEVAASASLPGSARD